MALLLSVLIWGLAGQQPALLAPKAAEEQPPRILTSPDPNLLVPPKTLSPPDSSPQWPAVKSPASDGSNTPPSADPWAQRQPAALQPPPGKQALPGAEVPSSSPVPSTSQLVADCFHLPPKELLSGRPVTLLEAISRASDRQQQLQVVRAYWQTARATANLSLCAAHQGMLDQLRVGPSDAVLLDSARASAAAMTSQARVAAIAAQYELAALMRLPANAPLPVAADAPHAGDYRTHFAEIFATRAAPEKARRTNATIPLRRQAMQHQAAAMLAADRLLAAMLDPRTIPQPALADVLDGLNESLRQRQALAEAVVLYNLDIAEYALAVAGPEVTPQVLVTMLIRSRPAGPSAMDDSQSGVQPAGYQQDPGSAGNAEAPASNTAQPTTAAGQSPRPAVRPGEEAPNPLLPRRPTEQPTPDSTDDFQPPRTLGVPEATPLHNRAPSTTLPSEAGKLNPITAPLVPVEPAAHLQQAPSETTLQRPLPPLAPMLYAALQTAPATSRTKQLAIALHWDRALPEPVGQPLSLQQALAAAPAGSRRAVIEAYWAARQKAAEYQLFVQQAQWLDELSDGLGGDSAFAAHRLAVARQQTEANLRRSHAELVQSQHKLAVLIGSGNQLRLPLPTTTPHAGSYELRLERQPPELARSARVIRSAAMVPALAEAACKQADAVVAADAARARAAQQLRSGATSIDELLDLTSQQTAQTLGFLEVLTAYNVAIADYALAVMPADVPAQTLTAALVLQP